MKTLYIVRHAKATAQSEQDFDRELAERGKKDAAEMGQLLAEKNVTVNRIVASPAARTKATALLIGTGIGYALDSVAEDRRLYNAEADRILRVIRETNDDIMSLMVVGHNPGISEFSNGIFGTMIPSFPTAGIAGGTLNVNSWKDVKWGVGGQEFFVFPE